MMESPEGGMGMVDSGVGTIVWVRRRNGSWWPGKILGSEELSASHLMSPRSGTPVKLLGREDASVDWYNLEKSKRVKPFRCGEFDDCIERAEASQGMPPKKREKYARREDAILHALELEKQLLEKKYGKSSATPSLVVDEEEKRNGLAFSEAAAEDQVNVVSQQVRPRLRGLQELGMGGPTKQSLAAAAAADEYLLLHGLEKRKRGEGNEEKRRDRRRPLVQLLKTSAKLPLHSGEEEEEEPTATGGDSCFDYTTQPLPDPKTPPVVGLHEEEEEEENNTTGSNEDTETDSSGTESLMSYDASAAALSDEGEEDIEFIPKSFGGAVELEHESMSDEEDSGDSLVSKWQLKGKRNIRRKYTERRKLVSSGGASAWMMMMKEHEEEPGDACFFKGGGGGGYYHDPPQFGRIKSMLIDVEVGVQSGYQREHVPMISLMSKLNDKAIVGHPIPIETLQDTASDFILLSAAPGDDDDDGDDGDDDDELFGATLQPWRTARRSAKCRVPRLSALEEEDQYLVDEEDGKGNRKSKKKATHQRKTSASSCNQKIRTLSSIGGTQQQQQIMNLERYEDEEEEEGVMKPESLPTAVACIPVKLVFSRLHEELLARHQ